MRKFIITGGPGAGKSTLLNALRERGYYGSEEVSRRLIQEQVAAGSSCLPWLNLNCFAELALRRMQEEYHTVETLCMASPPGIASLPLPIAFFDRAIPDIITYLRVGGLPVKEDYYQAIARYPYHNQVFMAPPWEAIYVNDPERWQTFSEATALYHALVETYQLLGFQIVELPKASVNERVDFVLRTIRQDKRKL